MSEGMEEMGGVNWKLCGCLLFSWIIVLVCLIRGISSLGKVRLAMFLHDVMAPSLQVAASLQVLLGKVRVPVVFCANDTNAASAVLKSGYCRREFYNRYFALFKSFGFCKRNRQKKEKRQTLQLLDGLLSNEARLKAKLLDPRVNLVLSTLKSWGVLWSRKF